MIPLVILSRGFAGYFLDISGYSKIAYTLPDMRYIMPVFYDNKPAKP
jgi:hypothetical protein